MPTPSDLFLSPDLTEEQARAYLGSLGFRDAAAVDEQLQRMADDLVAREALGRLAPGLIAALLESPNPDAAAAAMAHYVSARTGRAMFLDYLREDPRALHVLTYVLGASPHLGEILVRTPEYFHWLVSQIERSAPDRQDHEEELVSVFDTVDDPVEGLNLLRRWKRRETLRVGAREVLHHETVQSAAAQLSDVAAVAIDFALAIVMQQRLDAEGRDTLPGVFAVIATGALGAREMSYGEDVDLLYVYDAGGPAAELRDFFVRVGRDLTSALRDETHDGVLYKVGLPPWPQGEGSPRACSLSEYTDHYSSSSDAAERIALTRARPIAGDADLGARFMAASEAFVYGRPEEPGAGLVWPGEAETALGLTIVDEVTRALQVQHGARHTSLRQTGTLGVLEVLGKQGLAPEPLCRELDEAYVFLRSAEHRRQLGLPPESAEMQKKVDASRARLRELCRLLGV